MLGWLFICCGLGAVLRYAMSLLNPSFSLPVGTLFANCLAAFFMGYVSRHIGDAMLKTILTAGFLGGLGTYSTLNYELVQLFQRKKSFFSYLILTYVCGFIALILGILV